jgi:hypothetical protein
VGPYIKPSLLECVYCARRRLVLIGNESLRSPAMNSDEVFEDLVHVCRGILAEDCDGYYQDSGIRVCDAEHTYPIPVSIEGGIYE